MIYSWKEKVRHNHGPTYYKVIVDIRNLCSETMMDSISTQRADEHFVSISDYCYCSYGYYYFCYYDYHYYYFALRPQGPLCTI